MQVPPHLPWDYILIKYFTDIGSTISVLRKGQDKMSKRKGRYEYTTPRNIKNREYTSYEDAPLKDYGYSDPPPQNLTKKFLKVFVILFISVVVVLALTNLDNLTSDNINHWFQYELLGKTEGGGYPVRFSGMSVDIGSFDVMDGCPVYCSDTSLVVLNSNAGEYLNAHHSFASPIIKTGSGYSVVFNSGATAYKLISRDSVIYSGTTDKKIFDADVAPNGTYALLTEGSDYLSELSVYKIDNTKKFSYSFAEYYVNNVSVNRDGTKAALGGVSARNGGLISAVYILDFGQDNYLQKYEFEDSFIYSVEYLNNGNVIAVGSEAAYYIDVEKNKQTAFEYDMKTLTNYSFDSEYGAVLSLSSDADGRSCDVFTISSDGKKTNETSINDKVLSLDYTNEKIAVLTSGKVTVYNLKGKELKSVDADADSRKICFSDSDNIYVLGTSLISKLEIKD